MSSSNMNVGGRRQLPSWMVRTSATEQANVSEAKGDNKENDSVKNHSIVIEPLKKKLPPKKHDNGVSSMGNELQTLKKCEARTRKRKSNKLEEGKGERFGADELCLLKPCKESRKKRMATQPKRGEDRVESDPEKKEDGVVRKRVRNNAPMKNHSEKLLGKFQSAQSEEDELTVEDLVNIAEEYIKADRTDFQKSEVDQDTKSLHRADTQIGLGKHLTIYRENSLVNDHPLSSDSTLAKPLSGEGRIIDLSTFDPTRNMLDLLLGPRRRKKPEEVEMKTDSVTQKIKLDYELSKKNHNDTTTEVVPVMKKKSSLKDKIRSFLD